jgi:transposase
MAAAFSLDLRQRVVAAVVEEGLSTYAAARRFAIGISTVGAWLRQWRRTGNLRPGRQGQPKGSKLDAHETYILVLVEANKDITLTEIGNELAQQRGVTACPSTIWMFFDRRGITFKKRPRTPPSSSAPTSNRPGRPGSTVSPSSIPAS